MTIPLPEAVAAQNEVRKNFDFDAAERKREQQLRAEENRAPARRYVQDDDDNRAASSSSSSSPVVAIVVILIVAVIIAGVLAGIRGRKKTDARAERKSATTSVTTSTRSTPTTPARADNVLIPSCRCAFGDGQSTPQVTLTLKAPPSSDALRPFILDIERKSGFVSETNSKNIGMQGGSVLLAGDSGVLPLHYGVACAPGAYVLVTGKNATGWSSVSGSWKWNATLPASMTDGADAPIPPQPNGTDFASYCTPLNVQGSNATLSLSSGKTATLSLLDGKLR